ncbi:iron uptake system protein EfeO [Labrys monachus]|uniref:Iron uptake system component EfeO n=1 Tax=Labrys monachus TaxID=217067 RepID=A0ABU0FC95_9HYPH|nr:iron uptake system protein EfeO [Labrys monachus]MDQ0392215.1 iron uptake system component EfeO [Labrys monachus]
MTASRSNYIAVGAGMLAIIVAAGAGTYYFAARKHAADAPAAGPAAAGKVVDVAVTASTCEPNELTVPEGRNVFAITNKSNRAMEWEILQGVMVVEERENIAPGFTQKITARLDPGDYEITCGLLTNARGKLHVTALANAPKQAKPKLVDLIGPLAEYKVYISGEVDELATQTKAFADAVKTGDLAKAQALYAPARTHYERIEPVAELFSDLDKAIDARADDFEKKEADPAFTGFHRLEYTLFSGKTTEGLGALADRLVADVAQLQERVASLNIPPSKMVGGAAALIEEVASSKISGEEDRYSRTDLSDFQANIDGAKRIVDLLNPLTAKADATRQASIEADFAAVDTILAKYRTPDGTFKPYDALSETDRLALQKPVTALAESLATLRGTLGLD